MSTPEKFMLSFYGLAVLLVFIGGLIRIIDGQSGQK